MMNFDEFLEATRARVQEELPDTAVKIQQVNKLQGESYVGISVQPEGAAAAATFNIGPAFERYQADPSQENAILDKIASDARQVSSAIPVFEVNSITDYESAKTHLVMQVVPVEPNKEMLENIPHKTVEDIAVVKKGLGIPNKQAQIRKPLRVCPACYLVKSEVFHELTKITVKRHRYLIFGIENRRISCYNPKC